MSTKETQGYCREGNVTSFPNTGILPQSFTWRDAKGHTATTKIHINQGGGTAANALTRADLVQTAITGITNAAAQSANGIFGFTGTVQYGTAANYQSVQQKARMVFEDVDGVFHRYEIPAPKDSIFLTDGVTVDPAAVSSYISAMTGNTSGAGVSGKNGVLLSSFVGGEFAAVPRPRRVNILTLTPSETPEVPE